MKLNKNIAPFCDNDHMWIVACERPTAFIKSASSKALIPDFGFEAESPDATSNIVTAVCISRVEVLIKFCSKVKTVLLLINQTEGAVKLLANSDLRGFPFEEIGASCKAKLIKWLPRRLT